jgi:hypothetical protein
MQSKKEDSNLSNVILSIYGFEIKSNTLYEIKEKLDTSAPDGFKEFNTSKVLSDTIVDSFPGAIFDSQRGIWDTGLYATSGALIKAIPEDVRAITLKAIDKYIVKPIEAEKGLGVLNHTASNNHFWDTFRIELGRGKLFDSSKTEDLLKLFLILLHKRVTPKDMESHPEFKQPISMYCIVDKDSSVSREAEKHMKQAKANALFYNLLAADRKGLLQVLDYIGISTTSTTDDSVLYTVFNNFLSSKEGKYQNDKIFIDTVERYQTDKGAEEIYIHYTLKALYAKGKVKSKKGDIYLDDVYVDNNWRNASKKIAEDEELKRIFASLLE